MKYLLDTCAIIWLASEPDKLSKQILAKLVKEDASLHVSVISVGEIACAYERKRIELDRHWKHWIQYVLEVNGWEIIPIDYEIMTEAWSLPGEFHQDPADRIIVASARKRDLTIVSGDRKILDYPHVKSCS